MASKSAFDFTWLLKRRPDKSLLSSVKANIHVATLSTKELDEQVGQLADTSKVKKALLKHLNDTPSLARKAQSLLTNPSEFNDTERALLESLDTPGWPLDDATKLTLMELQEQLESVFLPSDKDVATNVESFAPIQDQKQEIHDQFIFARRFSFFDKFA